MKKTMKRLQSKAAKMLDLLSSDPMLIILALVMTASLGVSMMAGTPKKLVSEPSTTETCDCSIVCYDAVGRTVYLATDERGVDDCNNPPSNCYSRCGGQTL